MDVLTKLARVAVFLVTLGVAVAITNYYDLPSRTIIKVSEPTSALIPAFNSSSESVPYKAQIISLDFEKQKCFTTLTIKREGSGPPPDRLWVWTYFFAPDDRSQKIWASDPVEIREPFVNGDKAIITATALCGWCAERGTPRTGYYARVQISTESSEASRLAEEQTNRGILGAVPVLVQSASRTTR
ncbi:MAG: hypothetical protein H0T92_14945 [Pyrinomonadaceae bacterium]|jgi:hypothetical protein|nr:hypothetical protein [Pyrinomonadaceae bacterium]